MSSRIVIGPWRGWNNEANVVEELVHSTSGNEVPTVHL
jgi:hypothetical protein